MWGVLPSLQTEASLKMLSWITLPLAPCESQVKVLMYNAREDGE